MPDPIETKLQAARTRLILEKPFLGALVMHLPLVAADPRWCETIATDARAFYYNPRFIAGLNLAETQFMLAHEALHCALAHFARRAHRVRRRWDVACDHAVNLLLVDEGLVPPPGSLVNPRYRGLAAEEIYPLVPVHSDERTLDCHVFDGGDRTAADGRGGAAHSGTLAPRGSRGEIASEAAAVSAVRGAPEAPWTGASCRDASGLALAWRMRLASAAQQALRAGRLNPSWRRLVDHLIEPQLSWHALLARYLMNVARDDYSFLRASRREGEALLPGLASGEIALVVALDTSGSITREELARFVSELNALKGQVRARIWLHACDEALAPEGPWIFEPWEPLALPERIPGGGRTRFTPVFEWVETQGIKPDLLVYFTDAEGEFPSGPPPYAMLWLVKGRAPVPWGERVQLNY